MANHSQPPRRGGNRGLLIIDLTGTLTPSEGGNMRAAKRMVDELLETDAHFASSMQEMARLNPSYVPYSATKSTASNRILLDVRDADEDESDSE